MAEEYISRKAVRDVLSLLATQHFEFTDLYKFYIKALEDMHEELLKIPAADVKPVRHGKWMDEPNCWYRCSECGEHYPSIRGHMDYKYCPHCGARMDGGKNV